MKIELLNPYGFCMGVINVLKLINYVVDNHKDQPIYCVGSVVHNDDVNESLRNKGVNILTGNKQQIIDSINEGVVIFSAHGTDEKIIKKAIKKGLIVYNAVCPFVDKSFDAIKQMHKDGYQIIYIGKKGHDESNAALSFSDNIYLVENNDDVNALNLNKEKIAVINQTTLSTIDIEFIYKNIKEKYPDSIIVDEICNTTRIRQQKLISCAPLYDGIIVVGDKTSSNTMSLYKISKNLNHNTIMVLNKNELSDAWLDNKESILIASGASTPNAVVEEIYKKLKIK